MAIVGVWDVEGDRGPDEWVEFSEAGGEYPFTEEVQRLGTVAGLVHGVGLVDQ